LKEEIKGLERKLGEANKTVLEVHRVAESDNDSLYQFHELLRHRVNALYHRHNDQLQVLKDLRKLVNDAEDGIVTRLDEIEKGIHGGYVEKLIKN